MATGKMTCEQVAEAESEFPTFNTTFSGQRNDVTYTACSIDNGANGFFNAISRVTFDGQAKVVTLPPGYYGSEPLFAPRIGATAEDDGYLLEVALHRLPASGQPENPSRRFALPEATYEAIVPLLIFPVPEVPSKYL